MFPDSVSPLCKLIELRRRAHNPMSFNQFVIIAGDNLGLQLTSECGSVRASLVGWNLWNLILQAYDANVDLFVGHPAGVQRIVCNMHRNRIQETRPTSSVVIIGDALGNTKCMILLYSHSKYFRRFVKGRSTKLDII